MAVETEDTNISRRTLLTTLASAPAIFAGPRRLAKVRMGVVGGGFGSSFFWHEHPDSIVTAIADLRADRRAVLQKQNPKAEAYGEFRELVNDKNVDAVAIFSGVPDHAPMAEYAMKNGKHVVCAVPAAVTLEECQRLIDTVKSTGMTYMNAETSYFAPGVITCRKWAEEGKFGEIFYSEGEYHHDVEDLRGQSQWFMYEGKPTWRLGLPPMLYITHSSAGIISVTRERLTEVSCLGWGQNHPALKKNAYKNNPFSNQVALFKTTKGHMAKISEFRYLAATAMVRNAFYGTLKTYLDAQGSGNPLVSDAPHHVQEWKPESHWDLLPPELRKPSGHGGAHTHLTNEFVRSLVEGRYPAINVYEAVAFCAPGIVAHQSSLNNGAWMKVPDFGRAPSA